ncbi:restriction endonuclease subunit S [Exiguobacterium sp. s7]|jgi:type I restriction enzyme S subunit|uniref:restriction endonuclease subunit S n=1 Tax=Exiguobacterium sp. s7 TaxID=2751235 RepID=UPI001BE5B4CD|nr:restriction endonuclease subunit S [Exiguobacterium sp. s7]
MKTYEEYKSSEIEWIGEIPTDWDVKKIKWMTSIKRGASPRPIDDPKYFDEDGEYAWVRIADVSNAGMYLEQTTQKMSELGASLSVKREPGDIFVSIAGTVGKPCITNIKCCIHDGFVYFPDYKGDKKYFYYIFESGAPYKGLGKMGTQLNLNTETIGSIKIPDIPSSLQTKIGLFIDGKVHEIDTLLDLKQKQIEKLEQQRQSIITEAVTKGLNPNVKMKDSGVEWIGEVPELWEVSKLKNLFILQRGHDLTHEEFNEGEIPVYASNGIMGYHNTITTKGPNVTVGRSGSVGKVNYVETDFWAHNTCIYVKDNKKNNMKYIYYILKSLDMSNLSTQTAVPTLDRKNIQNSNFVYTVDIEEQREIALYLDRKLAQIDTTVNLIDMQLKKLKEYRQALIYEAVTGKIDVRDMELD